MNESDAYLQTWLSTSVPALGPTGTRLAGCSPADSGLSIFPSQRGTVGTRWKDDRESLAEEPAIARLAGVTQVLRRNTNAANRLDHSREVAEIAALIAAELNLSTDLASAIGLAHDCGHCPFGHAGERELQEFRKGHEHATWGADRVLSGRGYSEELLAGIRSHSWSGTAACTTPEAEIVRWSDRIAYLTRDFADALKSGLALAASLPDAVADVIGGELGEQRECLIAAVVSASARSARISMEEHPALALATFRLHNNRNIYQHPTVVDDNLAARRMVRLAASALWNRLGTWDAVALTLTSMTDADVERFVVELDADQTLQSSAA